LIVSVLPELSLVFANRVNEVRQADSHHFFPYGHAILLGNATRGQIFRPDERDEAVDGEMSESEVAAGAGGFRREALIPMIAADVVADLDFVRVVDLLYNEAAVADQFLSCLQDHRPEAVAFVDVTATVPRYPLFDCRVIERRGIEAHGFRIGEDAGEGVDIVGDEFAEDEALGF
jgi:hypothetical protein